MKGNGFVLENHCLILSVLLSITLLITGTAWAQAAKDGQGNFALTEVVVTAERLDEYVRNHPQDVEVMARKEIEKKNLLSVEEVLQSLPGVEVRAGSGIGSRVSIRGSGKMGGILVLLDGRPLNSNQYGNLDLNTIPVDLVQSVSVFKPPVPVWLGPGGSDGVIAITTRHPSSGGGKSKTPTTLKLSAGSFGFAEGGLSSPLSIAGGNALLNVAAKRKDGKRSNSDRTDGSLGMNWNREGTEGDRWEVNGRYYEAEYGAAGPVDNPTPDARQRYQKGSLDTRYAGFLGDEGNFSLTAYGDKLLLRDRAQSGATYDLDDGKVGFKADSAWSQPQGLWDLRLGWLSEWNDFSHPLTGRHNRLRNGFGGQFDRRFGSLTGTLGLRGDATDDFGFHPGVSTGLGWGVSAQWLLKAKAGYTVNVPTFEQLYQTGHGSIDQTRGNPNLQEERIWSYDVGVEYKISKDRLLRATLFRNDTRDLISSRRGTDLIYRPVNINRAERQGVELTGKYGWINGLVAEANLIWQGSRNNDTGKDLPYTPAFLAKGTLQYTLPVLATRLEGTVRYEGRRFSESENLGAQQLDAYVTIDGKMTQPLTIQGIACEGYVKVENLFNAAYESHYGYPDDGTRFVAGLQMKF